MPHNRVQVIILASGGIDSTALIDFYLRRKCKIKCIHFQYGQASAKSERSAFEKIARFFKVENAIIDLGFSIRKRKEESICRNALFVLAASSIIPQPERISMGIHTGSSYYDTTGLFVKDCQRILDGYFSGTVRVEAPFIDLTKLDIMNYCKIYGIPINLTYSCYRKNSPPCGKCNSCLDRKKFFGE
jgi:7-cyano-7-deazaguanine synthase